MSTTQTLPPARHRYTLLIPDLDEAGQSYPGGIRPGRYDINQVVGLLRRHKENPEAVQFLADMMEE